MTRFIPYLVVLLAALWLGSSSVPPKAKQGDFDVTYFSRIPVLTGGRIKPLDTVARNSLMIMRGKQTLRLEDGTRMSATRWLADVFFNPEKADSYPVFAIANQELLGMCGLPQADKRYCTFAELRPSLAKIEEERNLMKDVEAAQRTPFQTAIFNIFNSLYLYQQLKNSVHDDDTREFAKEIGTYAAAVAAAANALQPGAPQPTSEQTNYVKAAVNRYQSQAEFTHLLMVAPPKGGTENDWVATGTALVRVKSPNEIPASVAGRRSNTF